MNIFAISTKNKFKDKQILLTLHRKWCEESLTKLNQECFLPPFLNGNTLVFF